MPLFPAVAASRGSRRVPVTPGPERFAARCGVSGGVTFAAQPRDFSQKVNRKQYRAAMRSILSELVRQDRLVVVDSLSFDEPKTSLVPLRV